MFQILPIKRLIMQFKLSELIAAWSVLYYSMVECDHSFCNGQNRELKSIIIVAAAIPINFFKVNYVN